MNELTDQLITLFSSILITVMFLAVAVNIFRRNHAPDTRHPLKWRIPVGHLDMLDIAMCGIIVLYFSLGALLAAATPPGASAPPSTTNMELDSYKVFNGTCLNLILAFVLLVRMFHTGRMEALGLKKHSLKVLLYAPAAGYLLVLAIHFLLDKAGLFQWIEHATNAPAEQSIVSVLRHSSDIPLITVICFSAAIAAPLVEELIFRGVILNLFLERFSKTKRGILWAVILSGVLFGAVHLTNISQGVTVTSAMIQAINGAFLGVIFGAVYARSGNIWLVMTFHALVDFASLMGSGIFGAGTTVEQINQMSAANLIAVPVLLIPCIVLLRPKKLLEMEQEANHIVVFETFEEADRNAALSLALGMISILTGFMGYGLGIGIAGLIGGRLSRKVQPEKNGMALAGMILSGIGMAVSIIGMIVLCFVYSNLNGLFAVMMTNGVK